MIQAYLVLYTVVKNSSSCRTAVGICIIDFILSYDRFVNMHTPNWSKGLWDVYAQFVLERYPTCCLKKLI